MRLQHIKMLYKNLNVSPVIITGIKFLCNLQLLPVCGVLYTLLDTRHHWTKG
ncbi:hypothetical protein HanIR_Chr14g0709511 [Helianthus annuus]|nr:hypothetical protein HanIR_Chr14g0709511 [Helianthus annuus]